MFHAKAMSAKMTACCLSNTTLEIECNVGDPRCSAIQIDSIVTRMHSSRMCTARSLLYRGVSPRVLPGQRPPSPLDRGPPPWTEAPLGQRPPRQRTPPDRDPPNRGTPPQTDQPTETPLLDGAPPPRQTTFVKTLPS